MNRNVKLVISGALGLAVGLMWGMMSRKPAIPPLNLPTQPAMTAPPATPPRSPGDVQATVLPAATANVVTATTSQELERLLAAHDGVAVLDFHAEWCKPCKELGPRLVALAAKRPELLVISIDVMAAEGLATTYKADLLPMLVRMDAGKEVARQVGAPSSDELERWLGASAKP